MKTTSFLFRFVLLLAGVSWGAAVAVGAPSKELTAARERKAAVDAKVSAVGTGMTRLYNQNQLIEKTLIPKLGEQRAALKDLKANIDDIISGDNSRAKLDVLFRVGDKVGLAAEFATGGVGAGVVEIGKGVAKEVLLSNTLGEDPLGLKVRGVTDMKMQILTTQNGVWSELAELQRLIGMQKDMILGDAKEESMFAKFFALIGDDTRRLQAHNEKVRAQMDRVISALDQLETQHLKAIEVNDTARAEMASAQYANLDEQSKCTAMPV